MGPHTRLPKRLQGGALRQRGSQCARAVVANVVAVKAVNEKGSVQGRARRGPGPPSACISSEPRTAMVLPTRLRKRLQGCALRQRGSQCACAVVADVVVTKAVDGKGSVQGPARRSPGPR